MVKDLDSGDPGAAEAALVLIEADRDRIGDGYVRERLYGRLASTELTPDQANRARMLILDRCARRHRRHEFHKLLSLARAVTTPQFLDDLIEIPATERPSWALAEERFLLSVLDATPASVVEGSRLTVRILSRYRPSQLVVRDGGLGWIMRVDGSDPWFINGAGRGPGPAAQLAAVAQVEAAAHHLVEVSWKSINSGYEGLLSYPDTAARYS